MSSSQISEEVRVRVRNQANHQCGYCLSLQKYVLGILEIDHIIPKAKGGTDWTNNGTHIIGLTACGRVTVLALQLNNIYAVTVRQAWVSAGWHPPEDGF